MKDEDGGRRESGELKTMKNKREGRERGPRMEEGGDRQPAVGRASGVGVACPRVTGRCSAWGNGHAPQSDRSDESDGGRRESGGSKEWTERFRSRRR